jgi:hypothetical protein
LLQPLLEKGPEEKRGRLGDAASFVPLSAIKLQNHQRHLLSIDGIGSSADETIITTQEHDLLECDAL